MTPLFQLFTELGALGFGTEHDINGADVVDVIAGAWDKLPFLWRIEGPDGIDLTPDYFNTRAEAEAYLPQWVERFRSQGYYSAVGRRISLDDLPNCCSILPVCHLETELDESTRLLEEAHDQHIYAPDDEHPEDCRYCAQIAANQRQLGTAQPA